jgi:uncharacterized membrane protein (UPF0127 family)
MRNSRVPALYPTLILLLLLLPGLVSAQENSRGAEPASQPACLISDTARVPVSVEVADSLSGRQRGLMGRETLGPAKGMLFVYDRPRPPSAAFWMYQTLLPLDIAFIGPNDEILAIKAMTPCTTTRNKCPRYPAGVAFDRALEMNLGFFAGMGIGVGDKFIRDAEVFCGNH